jgi:hypothetical protein
MSTCPHCRESVPEGAEFCGRCGGVVAARPDAAEAIARQEPPAYGQPSVYSALPVGTAQVPRLRESLPFGRADVLGVIRDGLVPLAGVVVLVFGLVTGLAFLLSSSNHGGFHDWFAAAVIIVAGALGAPLRRPTPSRPAPAASTSI